MAGTASVEATSHTVQRLTVQTGTSFDDFLARFEKIVPPRVIAGLTAPSRASSDEVEKQINEAIPNSFRVFAALDATALLAPTGAATQAVSWLFGNQHIAERVFSSDPRAVLYAPMRLVLFDDDDGNAVISIERPSDAIGSLGDSAITTIGHQLDGKLAELFDTLGVPEAATALRAEPRPLSSTG